MVTLQISADDILLIYNRFVQSIAESVHVAKVRENYRKFFKADGRIREMRSKLRHGAKQLRLRNPLPSFPLLAEPWERHGKFSRRPWHSKNNFHDPLTRAKPGFFKWWGGGSHCIKQGILTRFSSPSLCCVLRNVTKKKRLTIGSSLAAQDPPPPSPLPPPSSYAFVD